MTDAQSPFKDHVEVLNYLLRLERLEASFYQVLLTNFTESAFKDDEWQTGTTGVRTYIQDIGEQETEHQEKLKDLIKEEGGQRDPKVPYNFDLADLPGFKQGVSDLKNFLHAAAIIENTGVAAYAGAIQYLNENVVLLTMVLRIQAVEARHAAYFNVLTDMPPFPEVANVLAQRDDILAFMDLFT